MDPRHRPAGMRAFVVIWFGQIISLLGTAMTGFGMPIWAYQKTGLATPLAMITFAFGLPLLLISPVAGALVDRSNRKLMMILSDLASGVVTIVQLLLLVTGQLQIWHLYVCAVVSGTFQAFQWPAFSAAISTMLPKEQLGRANGMMELAGSASGIFAPALAAAVLGVMGFDKGLPLILLFDIATFVFAIGALLFVHIPQPQVTEAGIQGKGSLWHESLYGFRYILRRPSLLGLQLVFMVGNLFSSLAFPVMVAMILARSSTNTTVLGTVESVAAIGGVVGGLAMSAWGGPKRRVHGVLGGWILSSLLSMIPFGIARSLPGWAVAGFIGMFMVPFVNGSNQAIWQSKVAPDVQGRVFAVRRMIAWSLSTLATGVAGPLADKVFEPAMRAAGALSHQLGGGLVGVAANLMSVVGAPSGISSGPGGFSALAAAVSGPLANHVVVPVQQTAGALVPLFGGLTGTGPGAGMGLMFVIGGLGGMAAGLGGYLVRVVRDAEAILPDYDSAGEPGAAPAEAPG